MIIAPKRKKRPQNFIHISQGFFTDPRLLNNKPTHRAGHTADALRLGTVGMSSFLCLMWKHAEKHANNYY